MRQKINNWIIAASLIIWPFVFLFPYVVPISGKYLRIGNDFYVLYYKYKLYLLALINSSHFPLWSPSEASGYPFFSSPFAQAFYPFNIPLAILYRIAGGYTILDHQRFTVLGISIFALGTFLWLRSLNIKLRPALFASLVMSVSYKVVEIIRFPNAIHTACWYPWIMYAITKIVSSPSRKQSVLYGLLLIFSAFCLITGGYPYYIYYSLFLLLPYSILILVPALRRKVFSIKVGSLRQSLITFGVAGVLLALISAPYLLQMIHLIMQTTDRSGANFNFATAHLFNLEDTLGSLVYPPASQSEGWYHFGFVGLFLILIFLLGMAKPSSHDRPSQSDTMIKVLLIGWFLTISYITYGKESFLFVLLWRVLPGFSNLRVWGRMNIILVPILAWLLALAYQYFEDMMIIGSEKPSPDTGMATRRGISVLAGAYVVVLGIQIYFIYNHVTDNYWSRYFLVDFLNLIPAHYLKSGWLKWLPAQLNHVFKGMFVILGFVSFLLCLFLLWKARSFKPFPAKVVFIVLLTISVFNTITVDPWMWTMGWDNLPGRSVLNVLLLDRDSFNTTRQNTRDTISLDATFNRGTIENWYFSRYIAFLNRAESEPEATNLLMGEVNGQKVYFSSSITPITLQAFLNDADRFGQVTQVNNYNGDSLELTVNAPVDGFVSFIDNWDPNWKAAVDGRPVEIKQLFDTFKSVKVPAGPHKVVFAYCPSFFEVLNPECSNIR